LARAKHVEWFHRGAGTLRAVARERGREGSAFTTAEDWYLCPLCIDSWFTVEEFGTGWLTVEHVPPEKLGGGELVLTCRPCNNDAGKWFDAHALKEDRFRRLLSGQNERPETAEFTVDGLTARGRMPVTGQASMLFAVDPGINNPADGPPLIERMRTLSETGSTDFRLDVAAPRLSYVPDRAAVSWVRSAYLAAFALLGWKYILQPSLDPVREQLRNPSAGMLPPLSLYAPEGDPGRREIWVVREPAEYQSLLVVAGRHSVFLPLPDDSRSIAELASGLGAPAGGPVTYAFSGAVFPWPSGPEHRLDPPPVTA
jgi:HNH endonuclease